MSQDSVNEKRTEPKTDPRECPCKKDKEESNKEIEEREGKYAGRNTGESVFRRSNGSRDHGKMAA